MSRNNSDYNTGDVVTHKVYGKGKVEQVANVERPSDGDSTMYAVRMEDGQLRNFKGAELKGGKSAE